MRVDFPRSFRLALMLCEWMIDLIWRQEIQTTLTFMNIKNVDQKGASVGQTEYTAYKFTLDNGYYVTVHVLTGSNAGSVFLSRESDDLIIFKAQWQWNGTGTDLKVYDMIALGHEIHEIFREVASHLENLSIFDITRCLIHYDVKEVDSW